MKKIVLALVLLSACASPSKRACTKLISLCQGETTEIDKCTSQLQEIDKTTATNASQKFADCADTATTCAEAVGCAAGAGAGAMSALSNQFMKGFTNSLLK